MASATSRSGPDGAAHPTRLGAFEILGLLGEGGSGHVYTARWGHREVALKVLHPALVATERERQRFFAEAGLLADITHPSVVKVLNVGALPDGRPYLAMEKLHGETLAARLARGPLPMSRAVELFYQLASAVDALHASGLVHRDLKPENVMLVDGDRFAVLLDFGIAKGLDAPASTITQDGAVRGTPAYMAPERFFGQHANVATDVYELGVVLYAMLAGRLPWDDASDPVGRLNPAAPSSFGVELPAGLETELLRALSTRQEARPASVRELWSRVQSHSGVAASPAIRQTADLDAQPAPAPTETADLRPQVPAPNAPVYAPVQATGSFPEASTSGVAPPAPSDPAGYAPAYQQPPQPRQAGDASGRGARGPRWPFGVAVGAIAATGVVAAVVIAASSGGDESPTESAASAAPVAVEEDEGEVADSADLDTSPDWSAATATPSAAMRASGADGDLARHHPADTTVLMGIDVEALAANDAFAQLASSLVAQSPELEAFGMITSVCGIDLARDVDRAIVGVHDRGGDESDFDFTVTGSLTRDTVEDCLLQVEKASGGKSRRHRTGPVTRIDTVDGALWLGWPDDHTFIVSMREELLDEAWMRARVAGEGSVLGRADMTEMLAAIDREAATAWLAGDAKSLESTPAIGDADREDALFGSLRWSSDLDLDLTFRYADESKAKAALADLEDEVSELTEDPMMASLVGDIDVARRGRDVVVDVHLTALATRFLVEGLAAQASP